MDAALNSIMICFSVRWAAWETGAAVRDLMEVAEKDRILLILSRLLVRYLRENTDRYEGDLRIDSALELCSLMQVSYYLFWICARPRGTYMVVYLLSLPFNHRGKQE